MKGIQYAQSSFHARVNQTRLCRVIEERKRKRTREEKWTIFRYERGREREKKRRIRMINAECLDMNNPVNVETRKMTCFFILITRPFSVKIDMPFMFSSDLLIIEERDKIIRLG